MATKIRLQRRGHKDYAFYSIVLLMQELHVMENLLKRSVLITPIPILPQ